MHKVIEIIKKRFGEFKDYEFFILPVHASAKMTVPLGMVWEDPLGRMVRFTKVVALGVLREDYEKSLEVLGDVFFTGGGISSKEGEEYWIIQVIASPVKKKAVAFLHKLSEEGLKDLINNPPTCILIIPFDVKPNTDLVNYTAVHLLVKWSKVMSHQTLPLKECRILFTEYPRDIMEGVGSEEVQGAE